MRELVGLLRSLGLLGRVGVLALEEVLASLEPFLERFRHSGTGPISAGGLMFCLSFSASSSSSYRSSSSSVSLWWGLEWREMEGDGGTEAGRG